MSTNTKSSKEAFGTRRFSCACSLLAVIVTACGDPASSDSDDEVSSSETPSSNSTLPPDGMQGGPESSPDPSSGPGSSVPPSSVPPTPSESVACPELERRGFLPTIGPWLIGPNPGPCEGVIQVDGYQWSETYVYSDERLSSIQSNDAAVVDDSIFVYDDAGRLVSYGDPAAPLTLSYAENGRIDTVASSQLVATFEFGDNGLLSTLRTTFTGDPLGGVIRTYTWEDCRLTTRVDAYETGVTEMATYSYDAQGNLISIVMPDEEEHYDYGCW